MSRNFSCLSVATRALAAVGIVLVFAQPAAAASVKPQELVEESRFTAERMMNDPDLPEARQVVEKARAVLIIPELVKGSFVFGAEGGSGVLLVRGRKWLR